MNTNPKFSERPVFVTGADGFVGSHLVDKLVKENEDVHAFVRATSSGELKNIRQYADEITLHRGDLHDKHSVETALKALIPHSDSLIFHLGAQAHVGESWERSYETVDTNITGTLNLLQSVVDLDLDIAKFDTAGTSEEYGNIKDEMVEKHEFNGDDFVLLSERSPVNPTSVYATSKLAADFLTTNLVICPDGILLGKRTNEPAKGEWFVSGGRIQKGEPLREAVHRIAEEELGIEVTIEQALGTYDHFYDCSDVPESGGKHYIAHAYAVSASSCQASGDGQHAEFRVFETVPNSLHPHIKAYVEQSHGSSELNNMSNQS